MIDVCRISIQPRRFEIIQGLKALPEQIKMVLKQDDNVQGLATELFEQKSLLVMGRGYNYATCLEGALVSNPTNLSTQFQPDQGNAREHESVKIG